MTSDKKTDWDYAAKIVELEDIIKRLQHPDTQIDEALKLHGTGKQLVAELEAFLAETKAGVTKLTGNDGALKAKDR